MTTVELASRDLQILHALTHCVGMITIRHAVRAWWTETKSGLLLARKRLKYLAELGYVNRYRFVCKQIEPPTAPVLSWQPGEEYLDKTDFRRASARLKARWNRVSNQSVTVYTASEFSGNLFGTYAGAKPKIFHAPHDLLLTDVYMHYREQHPGMAARFVHEQCYKKAGYHIADPDAFVLTDPHVLTRRVDPNNVERIVESGGAYGPDRVEAVFRHAFKNDTQIQLW